MREMPPVSLIVLNWNGRSFLQSCLSSLLAQEYPAFSVIVVDNASTDDSVEFVREHFPEVRLYCNEKNLGFAGGNNVALRHLDTEFAVLVNPDVVVYQDWLCRLITPMLADETIGVAGCKLYYPDGRRVQYAGGYITLPRAMPRHYGVNEEYSDQHDLTRDVDYVIGASMALRRKTLDEVGLLDEGYFLYYEDVDLCLRVRLANYRVVYVPEATATHVESAMTLRGSSSYIERFHTGRWRFLLKQYEFENILQRIIPAEQDWLAGIAPRGKLAMARVYRATLRNLPAIWIARVRDGGPHVKPVTAVQRLRIAQELHILRQMTWERPFLNKLQQKWQVQERPFRSQMPVLGTAIARFRTAWNNISAKWYIRTLVQQQNQVNQLITQRLIDQHARLVEQDNDQSTLLHQTADFVEQLTHVNHQLAAIEERITRLEKIK